MSNKKCQLFYKNFTKTFDKSSMSHLLLPLIFSSSIAAIGLATNSATVIIGSMLLSPFGGMILYLGSGYKNVSIRNDALKILGLSTVVSVLVGFMFGFFFRKIKKSDYPSDEMRARGEKYGLIWGFVIALFAGYLLSTDTIHGDSVTTVIGIGIATSLLPPLIVSGMYLYDYFFYKDSEKKPTLQNFVNSFALYLANMLAILAMVVFVFNRRCKSFKYKDYLDRLTKSRGE